MELFFIPTITNLIGAVFDYETCYNYATLENIKLLESVYSNNCKYTTLLECQFGTGRTMCEQKNDCFIDIKAISNMK